MKQKRWRQFSIRSCLVVTALVAICIVAFGSIRSHEKATAAALVKIEQYGGVFGYKLGGNSAYRNAMQLSGVSEKAFWETKYFAFGPSCQGYDYQNPLDDNQLKELSPCFEYFPLLESLEFRGCKHITDEGVSSLPVLPNLKLIDLEKTGVTENGVSMLQKRFPDAEIRN